MLTLRSIIITATVAIVITGCTSAPGEEEHPYIMPTDPAVSEKLAEWHDWKFGVLIHWGPYSQWGVVESWSLCPEDEPWCERRGPFADDYYTYTREYEKLPETFNPNIQSRPLGRGLQCRRDEYAVFTTKHHDGFAMFDTKQSDYKITGPGSAFAKDPRSNIVKEVFTAFPRKKGWVSAHISASPTGTMTTTGGPTSRCSTAM
jgi:alpha-L-fucosidase